MKIFLRILLFLSLVFIFIYLYFKGLLVVPELQEPGWIFISLIFVIAGFLADVKAWQTVVKAEIPDVSYRDSFISTGKYIFSKYIPGKFWIIIGKAGYLREKYKNSFINLASYSFYYQLIALFAGTVAGIGIIYFVNETWFWVILTILFFFAILFAAFNKPVLNFLSKGLTLLFRKRIDLPLVSLKTTLRVFLFSLLNWLIWALSFFIFLQAVSASGISKIAAGLVFPISSALGVIVLIAPGGLGVREGFMTLGLVTIGLSAKEAASVAVLSRLWFLAGETIFFLSALFSEYYVKVRKNN